MNLKKKLTSFKLLKYLTYIFIMITLFLLIVSFIFKTGASFVLTSKALNLDSPISFLLLGTDYSEKRAGEGVRSDSIMVFTINPSNQRSNIELNMVSIPRDTLVTASCTGGSYDKITNTTNSGYAINQDIDEGIACTKEAVENLLNIPIDYYLATGFDGVINLIDSVDGITVDVPYDFCEQNELDQGGSEDSQSCGEGAYYFKEGLQKLSGAEALSYARQRHASSDYERGIRQQQVIIATAEKLISNPTKYMNSFISVFNNDLQTNLDISASNLGVFSELINFGSTLYNNIVTQTSNGQTVYLDIKNSSHENQTEYISSPINPELINTSNIVGVPLDTLYDTSSSFESDTTVKEIPLDKNNLLAPSTTIQTDGTTEDEMHIELSTFSVASTDWSSPSGYYSYIDYDTLYYTSNLLRTSIGLEEEEPVFDYTAAGLPEQSISQEIINI